MKITIGSDHRGYEIKNKIINQYKQIEWDDVGANSTERTDYPIFAKKVCKKILDKQSDLGILICGSGIGMAIAANRFAQIYAGLCWNEKVAQGAKADDGINILVLPADFISEQEAIKIINVWLETSFKGDIYKKRQELLDKE